MHTYFFLIKIYNYIILRNIAMITLSKILQYSTYYKDFFSVIGIVKISRTRNPDSVVVYQTQRSVFLTLARKKHQWKIFRYVCIWCQMNTNSSVLRLWKPDVSVLTSIWWRMLAKISSIFVWDSILSMLFVLIKCYHVLELIGM